MGQARISVVVFLGICWLMLASAWAQVSSQSSILTVVQGSGGGTYSVSATVHIWADPPSAGTVFDRWMGDTQFLLYPNAAHTTLVLPATGVSVRATYKIVPQWSTTTETINGVRVMHYVPPNPVGLIFLFHGRGNDAASMFGRTELQIFDREAVAAGYGVVAPDSVNRDPGEWNLTSPLADNSDIRTVQAIIQTFLARGTITSQTPLLALGTSYGAFFAPLAMLAVGGKAVAHMILWGAPAFLDRFPLPAAIWLMAANDDIVGQQGNATALDSFNRHVNRGNPGHFYLLTPSPVYPRRFWRIAGLTASDSEAIYQGLKNGGLLDENNFQKQNPSQSGWLNFLPSRYRQQGLVSEILFQLMICYAAHVVFSDGSHLILELFDSAIGRRPGPAVVSTASFRPQSPLAPNSIVAVFGSGLAVATAQTASANLPENLAGTTATVRDSAGVERPAQLFFVSPGQVNLLIPPEAAVGAATLQIIHATARVGLPIQIARAAPGLFSANSNGQGAPAGVMLRVRADGSQNTEPVARYDPSQGTFATAPIDFGSADDQLFLILYGTGVRNPANPGATRAVFADVSVPVLYIGPQNEFPGLDQINVEIPRSMAGRGLVDVTVVVDGISSNALQLLFR